VRKEGGLRRERETEGWSEGNEEEGGRVPRRHRPIEREIGRAGEREIGRERKRGREGGKGGN
jgi:hypothetical protein